MSDEWFCQIMGSEVGPLNQRQLVDMVRRHRLNPEDLVRRNNSSWVPAFEVKGLFEAAAKPAPEPPPEEAPAEADSKVYRSDQSEALTSKAGGPTQQRPSDPQTAPTPSSFASLETATDWFCIASGEKCGPLGFDELQALARAGSLRGRDRVWRGSWPKFQKASEIEGLETN